MSEGFLNWKPHPLLADGGQYLIKMTDEATQLDSQTELFQVYEEREENFQENGTPTILSISSSGPSSAFEAVTTTSLSSITLDAVAASSSLENTSTASGKKPQMQNDESGAQVSELSKRAIAGIAVGAVAGLLVIAVLIFIAFRRNYTFNSVSRIKRSSRGECRDSEDEEIIARNLPRGSIPRGLLIGYGSEMQYANGNEKEQWKVVISKSPQNEAEGDGIASGKRTSRLREEID